MAYSVNDKCIMCKHTDCVEVCPVDCFYEGENMLVINPDECIDCGVCEPECPEDAILPDTDPEGKKWVEFNNTWSLKWPVITTKKDSLDPEKKHTTVINSSRTKRLKNVVGLPADIINNSSGVSLSHTRNRNLSWRNSKSSKPY